jgi:hypothetical protein
MSITINVLILLNMTGKASFVKYPQNDKFGALNIIITNNGYILVGKYYSTGGSKLDEFSLANTGTTGAYSYGPSLTLSGEDIRLIMVKIMVNTLSKRMEKERDLIVPTSNNKD